MFSFFQGIKTPYKPHFAGSFSAAALGYVEAIILRIKPGETFIAAEILGPNKEDLFRYRKEFETDANRDSDQLLMRKVLKTWVQMPGR